MFTCRKIIRKKKPLKCEQRLYHSEGIVGDVSCFSSFLYLSNTIHYAGSIFILKMLQMESFSAEIFKYILLVHWY